MMTDPFVKSAARYTALSEEYTAEVTRLRDHLAMAGHRGEWPHRGSDCFLMNCKDLYDDLLAMQKRVIEAAWRDHDRMTHEEWVAEVIRIAAQRCGEVNPCALHTAEASWTLTERSRSRMTQPRSHRERER